MEHRKTCERPFNLMKHMDGVEPCRMKRIASVRAQVVYAQMAHLLRVMAGVRSVPAQKDREHLPVQQELYLETG